MNTFASSPPPGTRLILGSRGRCGLAAVQALQALDVTLMLPAAPVAQTDSSTPS